MYLVFIIHTHTLIIGARIFFDDSCHQCNSPMKRLCRALIYIGVGVQIGFNY